MLIWLLQYTCCCLSLPLCWSLSLCQVFTLDLLQLLSCLLGSRPVAPAGGGFPLVYWHRTVLAIEISHNPLIIRLWSCSLSPLCHFNMRLQLCSLQVETDHCVMLQCYWLSLLPGGTTPPTHISDVYLQ